MPNLNIPLYKYRSEIVYIGNTTMELDSSDGSKQAQVLTAYLRRPLIVGKVLNNQESLYLLEKALIKTINMRIPDLEYIVMNTFGDIKDQDFF